MHGDLHGISIMTQRSGRWLIVGACLVLYALAMVVLAWAIREPTRLIVDSLIASVGHGWMLALVCFPGLAACIWAMWPDPSYTPPPAANTHFPRWVRIFGNLYLGAVALCVVVGMGTFIVVSLMR